MTHSTDSHGTDNPAIPPVTLGWRIQMALAYAGLKQTDLMDYFELSRGTISRWCRDDGTPKRHQLQQIALMTGVPFEWLQTGEAPTGTDPGGGNKHTDNGLKVRSSTQLSYRGEDHLSNVHHIDFRKAA